MTTPSKPQVIALGDLEQGEVGDFFALLAAKEQLKTRDGKPYYRANFRDARREAALYVWSDSPHFDDAATWQPGDFFKLRGTFRDTNFGPQLEVQRLRLVNDADREDGFDPASVEALARWTPNGSGEGELPFLPARVLLQDFTGVPAVVDLAAMRDAVARLDAFIGPKR